MNFRTDLALERAEDLNENVRGIKKYERKGENTKTTVIEVTSENAAKAIGKPCGKYITVETKPFSEESDVFDGRLFKGFKSGCRGFYGRSRANGA